MADRALVGLGLTLQDVGGERRIGELDQGLIAADLRDAGVPIRQRAWFSFQILENFDRVLLARDEHDGKCEGALLAQCRTADNTPFLLIEALCGASTPRDEALLKRLLAYLMLRLDTLEERPIALFARTRNPTLTRVLRDIARVLGGAGFYPAAEGAVISLANAALAHRLARLTAPGYRFSDARMALDTKAANVSPDGPMLAMLDLRRVEPTALDDGARHLFRDRLPRAARQRTVGAVLPERGGVVRFRPLVVARSAKHATPPSVLSL